MDVDDEEKHDPRIAEKLLSQEILDLSHEERCDYQEEIHGVGCVARDETPETKAKALRELATELDAIPPDQKGAYRRSQQLPYTYVNEERFRLRFLRCCLFSAKATAKRMVEFLEMSMVLFGPFVLARPVRLSDFSSKEMRLLRKGRYQFAPFPDKSGRRVLCVFLDKEWVAFPMEAKARMSLYMSWTAGDDVDTQRKGLVVLTWFDQNFEVAGRSNIEYKDHTFSCVRACAIHMCSPDTPMYQLLRAIVITNLGRAKQKLRVHLGSTEEIFLVLQSFGITIDQLPIGLSGIIKNERVKEWLRSRCCIEESLKPSPDGSLSSTSDIIEYPKKDDVLFRMGMSNTAHPGNAFFRHHLETTMTRHGKMRASAGKAKDLRKRYICEIIFHIKHSIGGRFLDWNKQLEGWTEMHDDEQIKRKIENLVKRSKGVAKSEIRRQLHNGKTSMIKKI